MKQILFIHGGSCFATQELFYQSLKEREYNPFTARKKKRRTRIQEQTKETHQMMIPEMPNKNNCDYISWKIRFERHFPFLNDEGTILIGHSQGGVFLTKRLCENTFPKKIDQLHLVASVFNDDNLDGETIGNFAFNPEDLKNIENQVKTIFLYHSKDDDIVPFVHSENLKKYLRHAHFEIYEDRGHFQQEEFPELLENLKK